MYSIINFHPFVDGNKRAALLSTKHYLFWNGYSFNIPYDADEFAIKVAKDHLSMNTVLTWLTKNSTRTPYNLFRHWLCQLSVSDTGKVSASKVFVDETLRTIYLPMDGLNFFKYKIQEQKVRALQDKQKQKSSKS